MRNLTGKLEHGFTLIEALLAIVVLAMAITAITMPFTVGAQNEQEDARRTLALSLAQEMMEEILAQPFEDPHGSSNPGPEAGESSRALFDNIDDYDGYVETDGNISDIDGEKMDDQTADGMSRHSSAEYVYVSGQDTSDDPTFIRVMVEIQYRGKPMVVLTRLVYSL